MGRLKLSYYTPTLRALEKKSFSHLRVVEKKGARVKKCLNYYPFGMLMPGRHASSDSYRYGAFGYEGDTEVKGQGNSYTTEFRQYDPRLGRWLSRDPVVHHQFSPYSAFDNNPIYYNDPSGGNAGDYKTKGGKYLGNDGVFDGLTHTISEEDYNSVGNMRTSQEKKDALSGFVTKTTNYAGGVTYTKPESLSTNVKVLNAQASNSSNGNYKAEASVLEGNVSYNNGTVKANAEGSVLKASAEYRSASNNQETTVLLNANASVLQGSFDLGGNNWGNGQLSGEGSFLSAEAELKGGFLYGKDGLHGIRGGFDLGVYTLEGDLNGNVDIFGLELNGTLGGSVASAHIGGNGSFYYNSNTNKLNIGVLGHLGLGLGGKLGVGAKVPMGYWPKWYQLFTTGSVDD